MKTRNTEKFIVYNCGECNHIMFFSEPSKLLRIECPMCHTQFKLQPVNEVKIIDGENENG